MFAFYYVDKNYVNYLYQFDSKVPTLNYDSHDKFFCGVVLTINNIKYYAPVSHDTQKQQTNFLIKHKGNVISSIKFSFMIPVPDYALTKMDFNEIAKTDNKYADLLRTEYSYCSSHKKEIMAKAASVYRIGINKNHKLNSVCCDFKKLELEYMNYLNTQQLQP